MIQYRSADLTVFESALYRTTSGVYAGNGCLLAVDPTWLPAEVADIRHFVDDMPGRNELHLLFTHSDYDHILGFGAFPGARTIASRAFVENPDRAEQIRIIREFDEQYYLERPYDLVYPTIDFVIDKDDAFLAVGEARLSFWLAAGHNRDGLLTLIEPSGILFTGDYLSDVEFPFVYHSFADYRLTLDKIEGLLHSGRVLTLVPGHGSVTTSREAMQKRIAESRWYLDTLEESIRKDKAFPEDLLWARYAFKAGQQDYHNKNMALFRKESGL